MTKRHPVASPDSCSHVTRQAERGLSTPGFLVSGEGRERMLNEPWMGVKFTFNKVIQPPGLSFPHL